MLFNLIFECKGENRYNGEIQEYYIYLKATEPYTNRFKEMFDNGELIITNDNNILITTLKYLSLFKGYKLFYITNISIIKEPTLDGN